MIRILVNGGCIAIAEHYRSVLVGDAPAWFSAVREAAGFGRTGRGGPRRVTLDK